MKILVVGSGGREHALAWKLAQSPQVTGIYCTPGNAGTARLAQNLPIPISDHAELIAFARREKIDLAVIGPDDALAAGIVDAFQAAGLRAFGPTASAARLESSKAFAKEFMRRHGIPTAASREFSDSAEARDYCAGAKYPLVVKADGLALGKGVVIAQTAAEAIEAVEQSMDAGVFGDAGKRIVIEEFLEGVECSIHALIDGGSYALFPDCRDHKQAYDGGVGPNTGGMGTISPTGSVDGELEARIRSEILDRFIAGARADQLDFRGMLFPGLMLTADGPKVLEFNCRWGDPETQVLVRRLKSDLVDLLGACIDGTLASQPIEWDSQAAVCVVLASGGYPGAYKKGEEITGIDQAESRPGIAVFHAGTSESPDGLVTNGGRVLGVTAVGPDLPAARKSAYEAADQIHFANQHRRNDIGAAS
ncbi:MAG TPA: phosphoribosylamine--glycine ligase [Chthoniobacterales bacterium]|nr:phosphoribosylamine--glycine ligase [Chthoniobacterales bacterium]